MNWWLYSFLHSLAEHPGVPDPTGHLVPGSVLVLARWHPLPQLSWYFIPTMVGRPHWLPSSQVLVRFLVVHRQVVMVSNPPSYALLTMRSWEVPRNTECCGLTGS